MDICGEARKPGRKELLELAGQTGIHKRAATEIIERIGTVANSVKNFAGDLPIRKETLETIKKVINANHARVI